MITADHVKIMNSDLSCTQSLFTDRSFNTDCCSLKYKRTFISYSLCLIRNLPDVSVEDFSKVDLSQYKWIHWEVRVSAKYLSLAS